MAFRSAAAAAGIALGYAGLKLSTLSWASLQALLPAAFSMAMLRRH